MRLNQVAFRYRRRAEWVLRDVTPTVPRGRVVEVNCRPSAAPALVLRTLARSAVAALLYVRLRRDRP